MTALEEKLGYEFAHPALLENALTHSSYANENKARGLQSNERLEFWATPCWAWWWPTTCTGLTRICPRET